MISAPPNTMNIQWYRNEIERLQSKVSDMTSALVCRNQEIAMELKTFIIRNAQKHPVYRVPGRKRSRCAPIQHDEIAPSNTRETQEQSVVSVQKLLHFMDTKLMQRSSYCHHDSKNHDQVRSTKESYVSTESQPGIRHASYPSVTESTSKEYNSSISSFSQAESTNSIWLATRSEVQTPNFGFSATCRESVDSRKRPREFPLELE